MFSVLVGCTFCGLCPRGKVGLQYILMVYSTTKVVFCKTIISLLWGESANSGSKKMFHQIFDQSVAFKDFTTDSSGLAVDLHMTLEKKKRFPRSYMGKTCLS